MRSDRMVINTKQQQQPPIRRATLFSMLLVLSMGIFYFLWVRLRCEVWWGFCMPLSCWSWCVRGAWGVCVPAVGLNRGDRELCVWCFIFHPRSLRAASFSQYDAIHKKTSESNRSYSHGQLLTLILLLLRVQMWNEQKHGNLRVHFLCTITLYNTRVYTVTLTGRYNIKYPLPTNEPLFYLPDFTPSTISRSSSTLFSPGNNSPPISQVGYPGNSRFLHISLWLLYPSRSHSMYGKDCIASNPNACFWS